LPSIGVRSNVIEVIQTAGRAEELYLRLVKSAVEEVLLIFPTTNAFIRQGDIGAIQLAREAANKRNARVRILMPADKLTEQKKVQDLKQQHQRYIDIRYIEQMEAKATILVVDRKASLVMEIRDDSKPTFAEAIGLSTYSNSKPGILSYVSIFENLWKQSELYQEIKESNERLEINGKILNEFIHIAAHELRNPIQPILGLSQIVKTKITQKEKGEVNIDEVCSLLDVVIRNARKLHRLTDDVLDITRIETNSLHLKKEILNLKEVMQLSVDDYISQNNIAKKNDSNNYYRNIKLSSSPSITEEEQQNADLFLIEADRGRISQVVSNLLSNAVKFTNECDTIYVNLKENDTGSGREFIVRIKDTGTGIDPEILPRLFTKFATKSDRGTGLGLFISKSIVEAHGGKIWAENNSDVKGATFAFSLPLIVQQDHHPQESRDISTTMNIDTEERVKKKCDDNSRSYYNSHKTKKRVFLVDDDYDHTVTFKVGLELAGFEVEAYNDSAVALSNFRADHYDLLLIDIKMPKIDGFELYEKISKIDDKVKVWFITAYEIYSKVSKEVSSKTSKEEMILDRFIQKPIEINNLVKQVKSELD
jgi:signal transduction histidine kinase/ActR/RegA family two-component response regulator